MNFTPESILSTALLLSFVLILLAAFLALARLLRGPTLADRVVALELMGTISVGVIAVYALLVDQHELLDAATVVALVAFLGTVGFANYIERASTDD